MPLFTVNLFLSNCDMLSISVYLNLQVNMCTTGEGHMICSMHLIKQLGELQGPFQNRFSLVITISRFHKVKQSENTRPEQELTKPEQLYIYIAFMERIRKKSGYCEKGKAKTA